MNGYYKTTDHILTVLGEKAARFLHGQFTNSITDLKSGQGNYNLFLTVKGRVRADLSIFKFKDVFYLVVPHRFFELIREHLTKMAGLSRCVVKEWDREVIHVVGDVPMFGDGDRDSVTTWTVPHSEALVFRTDRLGTRGFDVVTAKEDLEAIRLSLKDQSIEEVSAAQVEAVRIKNGVARVGVDVTQDNLPQEGRLDRALHFNKGCYLGQEVVARLKFRGHVNRMLVPLVVEQAAVNPGQMIWHAGKECGRVTSAVFDAGKKQSYLLGFLPVALCQKGTTVVVDGQKATVVL